MIIMGVVGGWLRKQGRRFRSAVDESCWMGEWEWSEGSGMEENENIFMIVWSGSRLSRPA